MADHTTYPSPVINADSRQYWEAASRDELLIRHCTACGENHFPPRHLCPKCWSDRLDWKKCTGRGTVYSYTVMQRAPMPNFAGRVPYVVALIDLEEGPRMMANVVGDDALQTKVGDAVSVCFEQRGEGAKIPQFKRARD